MDMSAQHPLLASLQDDPPPIPSAYPQFQRLDRSVICNICKEVFTGPVTVTCGHSFCSQCIRSSLDAIKDKKCPVCDAQITEGSIRRNRALEEITDAWEAARPNLITLCGNAQAGPSRRRLVESLSHPTGSPPPAKRRKLSSVSRSVSPNKCLDSDEDVIELVSSDGPDVGNADEVLTELDDGECPLCQARLPIAGIPAHIERGCPPPKEKAAGSGNQKADWKRVFAGAGSGKDKNIEMERIRKPNYAIAQPTDLRKILTKYELPTSGDKAILQWRIQQWIIIFNANLDTSHPQSLSALRAKLKAVEAVRLKDRGKEDKISNIAQYAKDKKGEFEKLRREIQERDKKRLEATQGSGKDSAIEVE